jgi:hypothetical protein
MKNHCRLFASGNTRDIIDEKREKRNYEGAAETFLTAEIMGKQRFCP